MLIAPSLSAVVWFAGLFLAFSLAIDLMAFAVGRGRGKPGPDRDDGQRLRLDPLAEPESIIAAPSPDLPYLNEAIAALQRLRALPHPTLPVVIGALRKVSPYAFEELLAICLAERGMEAVSTPGYSHDGGLDVLAFDGGRAVVVQAKRWRRHVSAHDIKALAKTAGRVCGIGLFIHTGRTGRGSRRAAFKHGVNVLSGEALVDLVLGRMVDIPWAVPPLPEETTPLPLPVLSALEFFRLAEDARPD